MIVAAGVSRSVGYGYLDVCWQAALVVVVVAVVVGDQSTSLRIDDNRSWPKARTYRGRATRRGCGSTSKLN
jgi:hypothetical protein